MNQLRGNLATTQRLIAQAKGLAYEVASMDRELQRLYPEQYAATVSGDQMLRDAQERWKNTLTGLRTTMQMQAQVSQNLGEDESVLADLVGRSQSAQGALQAMQATNQLLALQAKQSIQAQRLQLTQDRAASFVGTDPAGYAGLEDGVDWHWNRIFAGAALTTLLGVGAELAAPENRQDSNRIVIAGRNSAQDSINQVGQEITRRNMNIQPTLTSRPGLPVRIIVNRDLVLRPYQPLSFNQGASQ
ncbi:P-type conjugative transfer protein TrbJ [Serratia nevei]|uniref:P-type conjugative transfer protein TrbJ n=1 Tax=Serratia nevei TaxID=2703794 RepID=UPI003FA7760D